MNKKFKREIMLSKRMIKNELSKYFKNMMEEKVLDHGMMQNKIKHFYKYQCQC